MENSLIALSNELSGIVENTGKYTAGIQARSRLASSGVIWRPGVVVTAEHTIRRHDEIRVTLPDGNSVKAELAGRDPGSDLAVLRVEEATASAPPLSERQTPGQIILAVGRSPEYGVTANLGIIGGVGGPWHTWRGGKLDRFLRLDLGLHPASSGAAVVDAQGKLVGIATAGLTRTAAIAIPSETVERVVETLLRNGHIARGFLGVGLQPVRLPAHLKTVGGSEAASGLMVLSVEPASPAEKGGIFIGDTLLTLGGVAVSDTEDVLTQLGPDSVGRALPVTLIRAGERKDLSVTITERAQQKGE